MISSIRIALGSVNPAMYVSFTVPSQKWSLVVFAFFDGDDATDTLELASSAGRFGGLWEAPPTVIDSTSRAVSWSTDLPSEAARAAIAACFSRSCSSISFWISWRDNSKASFNCCCSSSSLAIFGVANRSKDARSNAVYLKFKAQIRLTAAQLKLCRKIDSMPICKEIDEE